MDEANNINFYRQIQISRNSDAIWTERDCGVSTETSSGIIGHCMGRNLPSVGILYQKEKNVAGLSFPDAKTPGQNNQNDGKGPEWSSINDQRHVFGSSNEFHEKTTKNKKGKKKQKKKAIIDEKDCGSIHVWDVGSRRKTKRDADKRYDIRQQQTDSELESRRNISTGMVSFERCPNRGRIQAFEPPLGELLRVDSLVGSGTTWTTGEPTTPCHFVLPNRFLAQRNASHIPMCNVSETNGSHESSNARNISLMLVEKIKNKYDRNRVATTIGNNILSEKESDFTNLTDDMESIKEFGFNHIIIVGERDYGILFLDCYGRMFDWDNLNLLLWPLGNYLEYKLDKPRVAWGVEFDGTITEFDK